MDTQALENWSVPQTDSASSDASSAMFEEIAGAPYFGKRSSVAEDQDPSQLSFGSDVYSSNSPISGEFPRILNPDASVNERIRLQMGTLDLLVWPPRHKPLIVELPEGAENIVIENGKASYEKGGVRVDLDKLGNPSAYHRDGFSFEYHDDNNKWYYHQDKGGDYVEISEPTVSEDGSVHAKEQGGLNSGRELHLNKL